MQFNCPECSALINAYAYAPPAYYEIEAHDKPSISMMVDGKGILIDVACPASKAKVEVGT